MNEKKIKIYLAGAVPKGDKEAETFYDWRKVYMSIIKKSMPNAETIDPNNVFALEGDSLAVFGADCLWIQEADFVIVYAEEKLGAGTAMEFVIAKYFKKPVITVLPKDTYHRRSNLSFEKRVVEDWIHPFIDVYSDIIVEKPEEIAPAIKKLKKMPIKSIDIINQGMKYASTFLKFPNEE